MTFLKKKRNLIVVLVAVVFVAIGLLGRGLVEPAGAHPGYSCNPSAGHGSSGCHRSTTPTTKKTTTTTKRVTTTTKRVTTTTKRPTATTQRATATTQRATTTNAPTTTSATTAANSTTTATDILGAATTVLDPTTVLEDSTTSVADPSTTTLEPDATDAESATGDEDSTDTTDLSELVAAIVAGGGGGGGISGGWIALLIVLALLAGAGWALAGSKWAASRRGRGGADSGPVRFVLAERLGHWSYALFFLAAGVTGALMWIPWTAQRMAEAYFTVARYHGYVGLAMVIVPISISFMLNRRRLAENRRELLGWNRNDRRWLLATLTGAMFRGKKMPPQGRFNAGQKINTCLVIALTLAFLVTGSLLIGRELLPLWLASGVLLAHKMVAVAGGVLLVGHMSMAILTPHGRGGLKAMVGGILPAHIAREGHLIWYVEWLKHLRQQEAERSAANETGRVEPAAPPVA